jgi:hypothetical protein
MAAKLLDSGTLIDAKEVAAPKRTALEIAIHDESWDVATLLVARGADIKSVVRDFFNVLGGQQDLDVLKPLANALALRLKDSTNGPSLVHRALDNNEPLFLRFLLDEGFSPHASDNGECFTVIIFACRLC